MKTVAMKDKMKFEVQEKAVPAAEPGKVVIKVASASICGSDYMFWLGAVGEAGLTPGHEFSGTIFDAGDSDFEVGDRVCVIEMNACGECPQCKSGNPNLCSRQMIQSPGISIDGGYAEYVLVRSDMVRKLPDNVSFKEGAIAEPIAVSFHGAKMAQIRKGDHVLVWGAGPIGIYAAACAKFLGASYVVMVEKNENRRKIAASYSYVDEVIDSSIPNLQEKLNELEPGGFKIIMDSVAKQETIDACVTNISPGGRLVVLGVKEFRFSVDVMTFLGKEVEMVGSWFFTYETYDETIELLASKQFDFEGTITKTISLDEVQEQFVDLTSEQTKEMKVQIDPGI